MHEHIDVGEMQAGIRQHAPRTFQHAFFRPLPGGQHLARQALGAAIENNVGKRAADIGCEANARVAVGL